MMKCLFLSPQDEQYLLHAIKLAIEDHESELKYTHRQEDRENHLDAISKLSDIQAQILCGK